MYKKFFLYLLFLSSLFGDLILHNQLQSAPYGLPVPIKAYLEVAESDVHRFSLLYRPYGNIEYIETPMIQIGKTAYTAEIPGKFLMRDFVEYYLLLEMPHHSQTLFPSHDAENNPMRIHVDVPEEKKLSEDDLHPDSKNIYEFDIAGIDPDVVIISPKPGERIIRRDFFIALSYFAMTDIDLSQIKIYLDEMDVSDKADIDSTHLAVPTYAIMPGIHTVRVNITNIVGQKYNDVNWSFTVLPGQIQTYGTIKEQSSRIRASYTSGNVDKSVVNIGEIDYHHTMNFDWLLMNAHYVKSSIENPYDQPSDRYYLYFSNEFINIKLGDSFPSIDDYAWNGRRIRGVNFSFNKGPFSADVINGKSVRAVQGNPEDNAMVISAIDSTTEKWGIYVSRNGYTFQQNVSAAKLSFTMGKKIKWDINYIKVQDNILSVANEIPNAEIVIPDGLANRRQSDDYVTIRFDSLKNNVQTIFGENDTLYFPSTNWVGKKPKDNFIFGSNLQFGFDDSRILIKNGFSFSLLNQNKWNNIQNISELDTLAYDSVPEEDGMFLEHINLDSSFSISNYESYISFGHNGQPMIPYMLQQGNLGFSDILNLSNLNRYSTLQLRYLGHRVELGNKRNGPDYHSLLNPYLKTNYKETYISDAFNLFQNKLFFYYKRSKITEGLYVELSNPMKIQKSLFNLALYPGTGLPTFNFGFIQSDRNNSVKTYKTVIDTIFNQNDKIDSIFTVIMDSRLDISSRQFNISMTNQFELWVNQVLSLNILLLEQIDRIAENISEDSLSLIGYWPKDAASESYGINLKTVYNNHWESRLYFNTSNYDYGRDKLDYNDDGIMDYQQQELKHYQLGFVYSPRKFVKKIIYGLNYSTGIGINYFTQYNLNMSLIAEPIDRFSLNMLFDYRIKYLGNNDRRSPNDVFFRAQIVYNIL